MNSLERIGLAMIVFGTTTLGGACVVHYPMAKEHIEEASKFYPRSKDGEPENAQKRAEYATNLARAEGYGFNWVIGRGKAVMVAESVGLANLTFGFLPLAGSLYLRRRVREMNHPRPPEPGIS